MRLAVLWLALAWIAPSPRAAGQDLDENVRRLASRVEELTLANEALHKEINALKADVHRLNQEFARLNDRAKDSATRDALQALGKSIEEVDRKRLADNDKVLTALGKLERLINDKAAEMSRKAANQPPPPSPAPRSSSSPSGSSGNAPRPPKGDLYEYEVQANDTLSGIVAKLNRGGVKVTSRQIMDVNPGVNWSKVRIGQKILIPAPSP
jgi:LysM repeat protein